MLRNALLSGVVLLLNACGAGAGFCTSDSQCPAGSTCDSSLGACSDDPAARATEGVAGVPGPAGRKALPSNYGHLCMKSDDCADVPNAGCQYLGNGFGACWYVVSSCPAGTVGPFYDVASVAGCPERCFSTADCRSGMSCVRPGSGTGPWVCAPTVAVVKPPPEPRQPMTRPTEDDQARR